MVGSDADRAALLRDAGGPAKLDGDPIDCIFRDEHVRDEFNGNAAAFRSMSARVLTSAVQKTQRGRSILEYGGRGYIVQDIEDDGVGFSALVLTAAQRG